MPNKPPYRTSRDLAGLQHRYEKLMKIFSLPEEEARRQALSDFLGQNRSQRLEFQEQENEPTGGDVGRQVDPPVEDLFTDVTSEREGRGFILPGPSSPTAFPKRSREEPGKLVSLFLDSFITDPKRLYGTWV